MNEHTSVTVAKLPKLSSKIVCSCGIECLHVLEESTSTHAEWPAGSLYNNLATFVKPPERPDSISRVIADSPSPTRQKLESLPLIGWQEGEDLHAASASGKECSDRQVSAAEPRRPRANIAHGGVRIEAIQEHRVQRQIALEVHVILQLLRDELRACDNIAPKGADCGGNDDCIGGHLEYNGFEEFISTEDYLGCHVDCIIGSVYGTSEGHS